MWTPDWPLICSFGGFLSQLLCWVSSWKTRVFRFDFSKILYVTAALDTGLLYQRKAPSCPWPLFLILICKGIEIYLWSRDQPILWSDLELLQYVWVCLWVGVIIAVFSWEPRNKFFKRLKWPSKGTLLSPLELLDSVVSKALVPRSLRYKPPSHREQRGWFRSRGTWTGSTLVKNKEQQHYFARIFGGEFTPEAAVELSSHNEEPG